MLSLTQLEILRGYSNMRDSKYKYLRGIRNGNVGKQGRGEQEKERRCKKD